MAARPSGICKMCLRHRSLASSHLIPSAIYKYCYHGQLRPIRVGGGVVVPTDAQTQAHLLCDDCEGILNRGGESWVAKKLLTIEKRFPLYEALIEQRPVFEEDDTSIYLVAGNPKIDAGKLTHFALGVFWRASIHSWSPGGMGTLIELGPYSDRLRLWLRGEGEFPRYVYLMTTMARPERSYPSILAPYEEKHQGFRSYSFRVAGLTFSLRIGKVTDFATRLFDFNRVEHPIVVSDELTSKFE